MSEEIKNLQEELNDQMQIRRDKLAEYEADGIYPFGQRFVVKDHAKDIKNDFLNYRLRRCDVRKPDDLTAPQDSAAGFPARWA